MKKSQTCFFSLTFCLFTVFGFHPLLAVAGDIEMTDAQNVKVSKQKAKSRATKNQNQRNYADSFGVDDSEDEESQCGAVDIGNIKTDHSFRVPREIHVIITGDVINANNDCE